MNYTQFKEAYPKDWKKLELTYAEHLQSTKPGKAIPMPKPEQYLKNALNVWTKSNQQTTNKMEKYQSEIFGHLDIFISENEDEFEGEVTKWQDILIHGDPEGLKSFARMLTRIADLNQDNITDLPIGAREHIHLRPNIDISKSSVDVIVGRIDAKGTSVFYDRFVAKTNAQTT